MIGTIAYWSAMIALQFITFWLMHEMIHDFNSWRERRKLLKASSATADSRFIRKEAARHAAQAAAAVA